MHPPNHQPIKTIPSERSQKVVELLKTLVAMPTLTKDQATNKEALAWIKKTLQYLPLHVTDFEHDGYSALILTTRQTKHPKVLLSAHIDIIPASEKEFIFREENGRYYGRGVFDMKFAIAVYMQLLLDLGDSLIDYDLGMVITTDEEIHQGMMGAQPLAEAGWGGDVIIDPDAVTPSWTIQRIAKGHLWYRLTFTGETGHGSRTWQHKSAVNGLLDYLQDLRQQFPKEPCGDDEHLHNTINVGVIQGGEVVNQIAEHASAELDVRIAPGMTYEAMSYLIEELALKHNVQTECLLASDPVKLDIELSCVKQLQSIITEVTGTTNSPHVAHGASEAGYYATKGMPVLLFEGPGGNNHAKNEWIDAKGLEQFAEIIKRFVEREAANKHAAH